MTYFAVAHAVDGAAPALARSCAEQLGRRGEADLGFIYATGDLAGDLSSIVDVLRQETGIDDWAGTVGHGICASGRVYFGRPALAVLACPFAARSFRVIPHSSHPDELPAAPAAGPPPALAVVHADPRSPRAMQLVERFAASHEAFLVGGLSSASRPMPQVAGRIAEEAALSGVVLDADVQVAVGLTQGCTPVGPAHRVTACDRNILVTLDSAPALQVLCEDLGVADGVDPRPWLANVHAALEVTGTDRADYVVRNLMAIDPGNGLVVIGDEVAPDERVMFVRRDAEAAMKDLARMLGDLSARCRTRPRAGLYFSCLARGPNLFDNGAQELEAIRDAFGDIPLVGFFGNGEISNNRIYGYTGVLTLFL